MFKYYNHVNFTKRGSMLLGKNSDSPPDSQLSVRRACDLILRNTGNMKFTGFCKYGQFGS